MNFIKQLIFTAAITPLFNNPVKAFTVTVEEPEIQTKRSGDELFVVDFDDQTVDSISSFSEVNSSLASTYNYGGDLAIRETTIFGGAENSYFIEPGSHGISEFNLTTDREQKYFGFWWSAGDGSNVITFLNNGNVVATFKTEDVINKLATLANETAYYCNPTAMFRGEICYEPYVFINFFFETGESYNEIVFASVDSGSNFESDNHTFSPKEQDITGVVVVSDPPISLFAD